MIQLNEETGESWDDGVTSDDPWGSLSPSGNTDPSWTGEVTGGSDTVAGGAGSEGNSGGGSGGGDSFTGGESQDYDLTTAEALAGQGFLRDEEGNYYKLDSSGNLTFKDSKGTDFTYNKEKGGFTDKEGNFAGGNSITDYIKKYGAKALDLLKDKDGKFDLAKLATIGVGAYSLLKGKDEPGGYNKPVPKMDMVREQIQYNDPNRRPGEAGRQYFTDPRFAAQGDAAALAAAKAASAEQAAGLQAAYQTRPAAAPNPYAGRIPTAWNKPAAVVEPTEAAGLPQIPTKLNEQGGINMAQGGIADAGRYLQGETDGMADKIPSSIDGEQPAALSHGEFVVPADVVSHLGNGNSDAGAKKLYEMMDRIRQARTGTTQQGKEINPDEFTMGGLAAAYASGGPVKGFDGTTGSAVVGGSVAGGATGAGGIAHDTSKTSTLSPWVGDYVTSALGQGAALAAAPYQAYQGPLTAGASNLQQQAFAGASDLAATGYQPSQYVGGFTPQQAQQYMNPYLQASIDPQLRELKRQSDIQRMSDASRMTKAGAYGGGRQAIMESEGARNLLGKQADVLGTGYKTAYDMATGQYQKEREAEEASRQFGANYGLKTVDQLANLGATERGITSEGVAADKAQFEEQRDFAYGMPKYQLGLLSGLPIGASTSTTDPDALSKALSDISGLGSLYQNLEKLIPKT